MGFEKKCFFFYKTARYYAKARNHADIVDLILRANQN